LMGPVVFWLGEWKWRVSWKTYPHPCTSIRTALVISVNVGLGFE
jgi:hypothetical protein